MGRPRFQMAAQLSHSGESNQPSPRIQSVNIPAQPSPCYLLMFHVPTGERYAPRIEDGCVTGCLGRQNLAQWRATDLTQLDYDEQPAQAQWAHGHWREFDLTG
jgi:hypothetical protein